MGLLIKFYAKYLLCRKISVVIAAFTLQSNEHIPNEDLLSIKVNICHLVYQSSTILS